MWLLFANELVLILLQGKVCGLCGNFDGNIKNDFTTRSKEVVIEAMEFGNSWKVSPTCPNAVTTENACSLYSHRQAWAMKHCSIIKSEVFATCHSKVKRKIAKPWHMAYNLNQIILLNMLSMLRYLQHHTNNALIYYDFFQKGGAPKLL